MRFLSLFAGIGGFDLGLERAGHECAGQVEIDGFCQRVLAERFEARRWTDVREWKGDRNESPLSRAANGGRGRFAETWPSRLPEQSSRGFGDADLLCGGFPCQDLSVAGKRAGLSGSRSGLFWEIVRIAKIVKPPWGLFENVPGLLGSGRGADMWTVLAGLRECWPAVGYRVLDSRYFGVAQRRRRVFFVCGPSEASVRQVLFESEGGGGDSQESGEAGEGIANTITEGTGRVGSRGADDGANIVSRAVARGSVGSGYRYGPNGEDFVIAATLDQRGRGPTDQVSRNLQVTGPLQTNYHNNSDPTMEVQQLVHSLTGEGHDASEDGTGRGTPIVATLNSGGNDGGFRTEPGEHLVIEGLTYQGFEGILSVYADASQARPDQILRLLQDAASSQEGARRGLGILAPFLSPEVLQSDVHGGGVRCEASKAESCLDDGTLARTKTEAFRALREVWQGRKDGCASQERGLAGQSTRKSATPLPQLSSLGSQVRRLTPLECELLQGFPPGWTCLCQPLEAYRDDPDEAAMGCKCPDSPRYRALGNAVTVNVIEHLGRAVVRAVKAALGITEDADCEHSSETKIR